MPAKPTSIPLWCTQNAANMQAPPASLIASGWLPGQPLPAAFANYSANLTGQWIAYLAAAQNSTQVVDAVQPAIRLLEGGRWSFASATSTLTWSADAFISFAGLTDAQNTLKAGSVTIPAGSVAFVQSNAPFVDQGGTTAGSTTITGLAYADQLSAGWTVSGTGIPANATIQSIDTTAKTLTLSAAATATGSGVRLVFTGSGPLTAQVADVASFAPTANTVVFARATTGECVVGVGSGQMILRPQEAKPLLGAGYLDVTRVTAGEALAAGQMVYLSVGETGFSRQTGQAYVASAAANVSQRAQVLGACLTATAAGGTARIVTQGVLPFFTGLTPGAAYYLSASGDGSITSTAPTTPFQSVVQLGIAISSTTLILAGPGSRKATLVPSGDNTNALLQVSAGTCYIPANNTAAQNVVRYGLQPGGSAGSLTYYFSAEFAGTIKAVKLFATLSSTSNWTLTTTNSTQKTSTQTSFTFSSAGIAFPRPNASLAAADIVNFTVAPAANQANGNSLLVDFTFQAT